MSKRLIAPTLAGVVLATASTFSAAAPVYEYAAVDSVIPDRRIVQVPQSREVCWDEPVTHYAPAHAGPPSYTPGILGGIAGAVVGNQFGKGSGRDWATVAGTALGASIGRDYGNRQRYYSSPYTTVEERCRIERSYREEEQITGYRVSYTYNGQQYTTLMNRDPGEKLRVRVDVSPAEY